MAEEAATTEWPRVLVSLFPSLAEIPKVLLAKVAVRAFVGAHRLVVPSVTSRPNTRTVTRRVRGEFGLVISQTLTSVSEAEQRVDRARALKKIERFRPQHIEAIGIIHAACKPINLASYAHRTNDFSSLAALSAINSASRCYGLSVDQMAIVAQTLMALAHAVADLEATRWDCLPGRHHIETFGKLHRDRVALREARKLLSIFDKQLAIMQQLSAPWFEELRGDLSLKRAQLAAAIRVATQPAFSFANEVDRNRSGSESDRTIWSNLAPLYQQMFGEPATIGHHKGDTPASSFLSFVNAIYDAHRIPNLAASIVKSRQRARHTRAAHLPTYLEKVQQEQDEFVRKFSPKPLT